MAVRNDLGILILDYVYAKIEGVLGSSSCLNACTWHIDDIHGEGYRGGSSEETSGRTSFPPCGESVCGRVIEALLSVRDYSRCSHLISLSRSKTLKKQDARNAHVPLMDRALLLILAEEIDVHVLCSPHLDAWHI